jgi:hypothetical protein
MLAFHTTEIQAGCFWCNSRYAGATEPTFFHESAYVGLIGETRPQELSLTLLLSLSKT